MTIFKSNVFDAEYGSNIQVYDILACVLVVLIRVFK